MTIVLDTNCLLQIIGKKSLYRKLLDTIIDGKINLLLSNDVLLEYEEILTTKISNNFSYLFLTALLEYKTVRKIDIYFQWNLISIDPDDNKFIDLGLNGNADFLITNDSHFNIIKNIQFPTLKIISLKDYFNDVFDPQ
jgi:uncharacterized protein